FNLRVAGCEDCDNEIRSKQGKSLPCGNTASRSAVSGKTSEISDAAEGEVVTNASQLRRNVDIISRQRGRNAPGTGWLFQSGFSRSPAIDTPRYVLSVSSRLTEGHSV